MDETTGPTTPTTSGSTPTPGSAGALPPVRGAAHLMTAIPHLIGYRPGRSLVVVATVAQAAGPRRPTGRGTMRGRMVMTVRADLAAPGDVQPALTRLAPPVARLRAQHGEDLVLHCYLWDADEELGLLAARTLLEFAEDHRVRVNDVAVVGIDAYLPLVEAGGPVVPGVVADGKGTAGHAPHAWLPMPAPADVPLVADLVLQGRAVAPGRDAAVARMRRRDEAASRATEQALLELAPGQLDGSASLAALGRWVCGGSFVQPPTAQDRAAVALVLQDRTLRDLVLARWLPRLFSLEDLLEPEAVERMCELLPPWPVDHGTALDRLITLAGQVPVDLSVPFVTLAGLLAWGTGEGTLANEAADLALELDPDYRMARLLRQALEHGMPPEIPRNAERTPAHGEDAAAGEDGSDGDDEDDDAAGGDGSDGNRNDATDGSSTTRGRGRAA
ncbi:DUF4192 domain-containing protein [Ornithinimicrobium sp. W1665]|uniref:DUF4192 domain-containing protein n=1 Tax=Ornithinimicrobium sp. W1665 TaxID=3416666 RepID=UPI003CF363C9